jgi:hypothetical protein
MIKILDDYVSIQNHKFNSYDKQLILTYGKQYSDIYGL